MNRRLICVISLLLATLIVYGQEKVTDVSKISISTNPLKLVMGLINLEIEYQIASSLSLVAFAECLVADYAIERSDHPGVVTRIGTNYYPFVSRGSQNEGLYGSVNIGYSYSRDNPDLTGFAIGAEVGYKWVAKEWGFLMPRGLLTWPIGKKILPGFELLCGLLL